MADSSDSPTPAAPAPVSSVGRGRRARTKEENRALILAAARRVFAESGFAAVTVRDVIGATNLAAGTFYNYFKSKEDVYQALHDEVALAVRPGLRAARQGADTAQAFLAATFQGFLSAALMHGADFAPRPAGTARLRMDTPEVVAGIAELKTDIEDAVARGVLPALDAERLTAAIVGLGFELSHSLKDAVDVDKAADFATRLLLGGLGGVSVPAPIPAAPAPEI
jgi:AcrR family transcriptional regulator